MNIGYKEYQQYVGKHKIFKVMGWFFLIIGILVFMNDLFSYFTWNAKKDNYRKEYVYSELGTLYYEENGEKIYIQNIYNTDNKKIEITIPNSETIIMYINKENRNEGIYFDLDNTIDQGILNPTMNLLSCLFLVAMGVYFIQTQKEAKENKTTTKPLFLIFLFLFLIGIGVVIFQIYNTITYINLKAQNNVTVATIYSEIYHKGTENNRYKPISYYYINGEKYICISDTYEKGTLTEKLGDTFEVYYDQKNPNKVVKKENPIDIFLLIIGIGFTVVSFPFVFLRTKGEKRIQETLTKQK